MDTRKNDLFIPQSTFRFAKSSKKQWVLSIFERCFGQAFVEDLLPLQPLFNTNLIVSSRWFSI